MVGSLPFAGRQGVSVMWAHLQDGPPNPCELREEVSEKLVLAVLQALEKEPSQRSQAPTRFAVLLAGAASG
jgi:hypothetical protein